MREPTTEESWLDTWISGCQENMNQCSGCLIDEKECQTAYDTISKRLEKPVTVSRDDIDKLLARIYGAVGEYRGNKIVEIWLTELDIEVSDNSEVSRRTSDKEGV